MMDVKKTALEAEHHAVQAFPLSKEGYLFFKPLKYYKIFRAD